MIENASKILEIATEFCRNNLEDLMAYGALLLIFIVIFSIVRTSRKNDNEDLDFDEIAYKKNLHEKINSGASQDAVTEVEFVEVVLPPLTARVVIEDEVVQEIETTSVEFVAVELPPLTARVDAFDDEVEAIDIEVDEEKEEPVEETNEPEGVEEPEAVEEPKMVEEPKVVQVSEETHKKASTVKNIVEELAALSGDGVKEVEINVGDAQVKITYKKKGDTLDKPAQKESFEGEEAVSSIEKAETQHEDHNQLDSNKYLMGDKPVIDGTNRIKFGPENMNVARSGRVYSEEELEQQIRD